MKKYFYIDISRLIYILASTILTGGQIHGGCCPLTMVAMVQGFLLTMAMVTLVTLMMTVTA